MCIGRSSDGGRRCWPCSRCPRTATPIDSLPLDPLTVARAYEAEHPVAVAQARAATPAPAYSSEVAARGGDALYSGERLPTSGGVRPEYAQSGQWIARP